MKDGTTLFVGMLLAAAIGFWFGMGMSLAACAADGTATHPLFLGHFVCKQEVKT